MKLNIYGWNILKSFFPDFLVSKNDLKDLLLKQFSSFEISQISVIYTTPKHIQKLNNDFRKKDSPTDVLSFVIEKKPLFGEIYICPEYISKEYSQDEILRDIVHGFLHIIGYDHEKEFTNEEKGNEKMFVKQENMLQNILYEINNRTGKSR